MPQSIYTFVKIQIVLYSIVKEQLITILYG